MNLYRIIDANCNRICEGLRVAEDFARFVFKKEALTQKIKTLRHQFIKTLSELLGEKNKLLIIYRDSETDMGRNVTFDYPKSPLNEISILQANFRRAEEALRVLEETMPLLTDNVSSSNQFKTFRFQLYALEKELIETLPKIKLTKAPLCVIYDSVLVGKRADEELIPALIAGGATMIQLRDKISSTKEFLERAKKIKEIINSDSKNVSFIINDRADIALAVDADGVHLGQLDLPIKVARKIVGIEKIIGVSVSTVDEAILAEKEGADYLGVGPIFSTTTKLNVSQALGVGIITEVKDRIHIPFYAIGGINYENLKEVINAGATRVAIGRGILETKDVKCATELIMQLLTQRSDNKNN